MKYFKKTKKERKICLLKKDDIETLKKLGKNENIHFTRPDKGRGIVILDKEDYINKMELLLSNHLIFENRPHDDPIHTILKVEDRVNRLLKKMKENATITENEYKQLYATGSLPNILYGLPKTHKQNCPMRPIVSSYKSPQYKLSKFVISEINHLTENEYSLKNSQHLLESLKNVNITNTSCLVSFDIESLYTNIPVKETIDIITDSLYSNDSFRNLNRNEFRKLLTTIAEDNFIIFNNKFFKQIEGLAMGSPISATFANIFMSYHEQNWLRECLIEFKPILYKRYVDDIFVLFKNESDVPLFFDYINNKHRNIKFTIEKENQGKLPFLDILIEKTDNRLETSVYRKPTFSGLGINFLSACSFKYKINSILTLIHRAYNLSSSYLKFHEEVKFLRQFFFNNGFNINLFYKILKQFLDNKLMNKSSQYGPKKKDFYVKVPFISNSINNIITEDFKKIFDKYIPHTKVHFVFYNNFKIKSFFKIKDSLPSSEILGSLPFQVP